MTKPARVTQSELDRHIRAANRSRVPRTVETMPDGTIRIVPVEHAQPVKPVAIKREVVM
jgi:hypothetical protein